MNRIPVTGPAMMAALRYIAGNPGCTNYEVATEVGPHGSHGYGDRTVKRCAAHGLIANGAPWNARAYAWYLTPAGRLELRADMVRRKDIEALSQAAAVAGDMDQVILCSRALRGVVDGPSWQACARVVAEHACSECLTPYDVTCEACEGRLCDEHARTSSAHGTFCVDVLRCSDRMMNTRRLTAAVAGHV